MGFSFVIILFVISTALSIVFSNIISSLMISAEKKSEEVEEGSERLNYLVSNIKNIMGDLLGQSQELAASAQEGNATIEVTKDLINNISAGIQEISASSEEVASFAQRSQFSNRYRK